MELTKDQMVDLILSMTDDYTELYFADQKNKGNTGAKFDKQLWAALHIGFITGAKLAGYSENELLDAIKKVQDKIK